MRRYNQISGQNIQRIEFLSDGVFAIATARGRRANHWL